MPAVAYNLLQKSILRKEGPDSTLAKALGRDVKGKLSPLLIAAAILLSFVNPLISGAIYALIALMWLIPDPRIERVVGQ